MDTTAVPVCPKCGNTVFPTDEFCAHCGFQLSFQHNSISVWRQIWIYFVSFVLPPFGLIWTFKYFRSSKAAEKRVAIIALVLTILSIIVNFWIGFGILASVQQQMSQYNSLNNLGL